MYNSINIKKINELKNNNNNNKIHTKALFNINKYVSNMIAANKDEPFLHNHKNDNKNDTKVLFNVNRTVANMIANEDEKSLHIPNSDKKDGDNLQIQQSLGITLEASGNTIAKSRRQNDDTKWSVCKDLMADYSQNSTISGLNYLFEVQRPFYERIYWIVVMSVSLYLAFTLILDTYVKWSDSPIIITFDETLVPTKNIPFPTVTVCPEIKMEAGVFDFANVSRLIWSEIEEYKKFENRKNLTDEELQRFASVLQICDTEVIERFSPYMPKNVTVDVTQTLMDLASVPNETIPYCNWNGRNYFGGNIFKYVITDEGVCYQFNSLHTSDIYRDPNSISYSDDRDIDFNNYDPNVITINLEKFNEIVGKWSLEKGYQGQGFNSYPQRSIISSARNSFYAFMLGFEYNFEYTCRSFRQGYKIFLNSPESVLSITDSYILVPHDYELIISIIPQYITATENIQDYDPEKRQCFFDKERYLRFFKTYSKSNCETECLVNFTIAKCGCAKFWMPKPLDTPICSLTKVDCYSNAAEEMNSIIANQSKLKLIDPNVKVLCNCMPSCHSLAYDFEIIRSVYEMKKTLTAFRAELEEVLDGRGSRFILCFKEAQFTAMKRTVIFGFTTLISNCGGIFGLFMGLSTTSVIEFMYYFSMRLFNNLMKKRKIKKQNVKRELQQKY